VLQITQVSRRGRVQMIKLEGELREPWAGAARDACTKSDRRSNHLRVDLTGVNYVDAAGVRLLRDLMRDGIDLVGCSSFVGELLYREG
jgi:anti-anti-sigma regulatory factor